MEICIATDNFINYNTDLQPIILYMIWLLETIAKLSKFMTNI